MCKEIKRYPSKKGEVGLQTLIEIKGEQFEVLSCENQFILHPLVFGILPVWKDSSPFDFELQISLDNYKIALHEMWVEADCALPIINGILPKYVSRHERDGALYDKLNIPIQYTGAILMAHTLVNDYGIQRSEGQNYPCFCYKVVYEYIFENGILITTIDHSRAMIRIRKNLDLGYRDIKKKRDLKCIQQFIKTSLVGDYKQLKRRKKLENYLSNMRELYKEHPCISLEINIDTQ